MSDGEFWLPEQHLTVRVADVKTAIFMVRQRRGEFMRMPEAQALDEQLAALEKLLRV